MKALSRLWMSAVILLVWASCCYASPETLIFYSYHNAPPFIINSDSASGLNYDFVKAMQLAVGEKYTIEYQFIDRVALNQRLAEDKPTILMWANPKWFDVQGLNFSWTQATFLDSDVVVSLRSSSFKYEGQESLLGKTVGARAGHNYSAAVPLLGSEKIKRVDASSDEENIENLLSGKVDAIFIVRSSALYIARAKGYVPSLYMSKKPLYTYRRYLLLTHHYQHVMDDVDRAIMDLSDQFFWQKRLKLYDLNSL
ncbi:transporter substrate-binding domain-containing protein [Dasania sp. GY-MA-18]|uniref:Transporter substrate-binding domain-containing protein n=2 Tax=Dasania phycosphaerae TaxID=2950436 RepID=A0A9J6RHR8_9GAMM|nr:MULTISPECIES: transporter substrate-binding domain-containing protein [Dasania]MCR8921323.1 transporter substrate-binding domain-containing protein [Dasania sp. GY-MA-18]MCZ0863751.1 transporter substrate-binding domain-containing protein [Dasania phycosphaerae]MCZ0867479.1 transporter substrate-binding domain-containing protein [Dasania phycosphaerae]